MSYILYYALHDPLQPCIKGIEVFIKPPLSSIRSRIIPVCSYIIQPSEGQFNAVLQSLSSLLHCEATPSEQESVIVLVTDTDSLKSEKSLREQIKNLSGVDHCSLTFGEIDPDEEGV